MLEKIRHTSKTKEKNESRESSSQFLNYIFIAMFVYMAAKDAFQLFKLQQLIAMLEQIETQAESVELAQEAFADELLTWTESEDNPYIQIYGNENQFERINVFSGFDQLKDLSSQYDDVTNTLNILTSTESLTFNQLQTILISTPRKLYIHNNEYTFDFAVSGAPAASTALIGLRSINGIYFDYLEDGALTPEEEQSLLDLANRLNLTSLIGPLTDLQTNLEQVILEAHQSFINDEQNQELFSLGADLETQINDLLLIANEAGLEEYQLSSIYGLERIFNAVSLPGVDASMSEIARFWNYGNGTTLDYFDGNALDNRHNNRAEYDSMIRSLYFIIEQAKENMSLNVTIKLLEIIGSLVGLLIIFNEKKLEWLAANRLRNREDDETRRSRRREASRIRRVLKKFRRLRNFIGKLSLFTAPQTESIDGAFSIEGQHPNTKRLEERDEDTSNEEPTVSLRKLLYK